MKELVTINGYVTPANPVPRNLGVDWDPQSAPSVNWEKYDSARFVFLNTIPHT